MQDTEYKTPNPELETGNRKLVAECWLPVDECRKHLLARMRLLITDFPGRAIFVKCTGSYFCLA